MDRESRLIGNSRPKQLFFKHVLRKIFLEDWVLKLTALVITLALWLGVTGLSTPVTKRFTVPLVISYSNNAEITNTPVSEVDIVITGDKRKLDQINRSELSAVVDLSDQPPGDRVLQLTGDNVAVALPPGVKLDEIQPSRIAVRLEAVEEKDIEVKPQLTGQPAAGYEVYASVANPVKVRVRGPESYISDLEAVQTGPIDISGAKDDQTAKQVPVSVPNPKAAVYSTVVDVDIRIGERRVERTFVIPVREGNKRARVVLFGGRSVLSAINSEELRVELTKNEDGAESPRLVLPPAIDGKVEVRSIKIRS